MVLAVLIFLNALLSANANPHKAPCVNKAAGDTCEYGSPTGRGVCCTTRLTEAGMRHKFCRNCDSAGLAKTQGECTLAYGSYLGCFRRSEDTLVFQTCHGVPIGSSCSYETAASRRRKTPAFNTTGACLQHIYHQAVMCLEEIGDADDAECNGKEVGQPCNHSESPNAICVHDPRKGGWMCSAPNTSAPVFAVCEGQEKGTPCSYTTKVDPRFDNSMDSGLSQGVCDLQDESHTTMMCLALTVLDDAVSKPEDVASKLAQAQARIVRIESEKGTLNASLASKTAEVSSLQTRIQELEKKAPCVNEAAVRDEDEDEGFVIILIIAGAAVSLVVGCIAGGSGVRIMQGRTQQNKPATTFQPDRTHYPPHMAPDSQPGSDAHPASQPIGNGEKAQLRNGV